MIIYLALFNAGARDVSNAVLGTDLRAVILPEVQRALSIFTMLVAADEMSIGVSDAGHVVTRTDNLAPASDGKIFLYKKNLAERGWTAMESLLSLLDTHREALGELYLQPSSVFLQSAWEYQMCGNIDIKLSRMAYQHLLQYIRIVEQTDVLTILETDVLCRVDGSVDASVEEKLLGSYLQKYVAAKSMALAIEAANQHEQRTTWDFVPLLPLSAAVLYRRNADYYYSKVVALRSKALEDTYNSKDKGVFSM
jgi:hypothetical protein